MRALLLGLSLIALPASAELFVDVGITDADIDSRIAGRPDTVNRTESGLHLGVGARRSVGERSDLSVRLELDNLGSDLMLAVRALDYRYNVSEKFAVNAFLGVARLDLATPAYGFYVGAGVQWKEVLSGWDLSLDLRWAERVARDNLLPSDPTGPSPDNFHDVAGISVYLSRRF